ncbi:MAG: hypothetical protein ACXAC5_07705 [Promethearchaeota archaeon]|jgi:hypothetical protein
MEDSSKQLEKVGDVRSRGGFGGAIILMMIGIFIMVGGIIGHIVLAPIAGQNVGLATVPLIALGIAIVMGSIIYPYRKRIRMVGCYCCVLLLI